MRRKHPKLVLKTGEQARTLRRQLGMTQSDFWSQISVTQSGGSRYEAGRAMPISVQYLLQIAHGPKKEAGDLVEWLQRTQQDTRPVAPCRKPRQSRLRQQAFLQSGAPG